MQQYRVLLRELIGRSTTSGTTRYPAASHQHLHGGLRRLAILGHERVKPPVSLLFLDFCWHKLFPGKVECDIWTIAGREMGWWMEVNPMFVYDETIGIQYEIFVDNSALGGLFSIFFFMVCAVILGLSNSVVTPSMILYLHHPHSTEQRKMRKYKVGSGPTKGSSIRIHS